jgi:dihydroorotate dehydrogenase
VRAAGAQVVEANLSCPNVRDREGQVYCDPELAGRVAAALRRGARDLPILLKASPIEDDKTMAAFLRAIAPAASGVVMINAPRYRPRTVVSPLVQDASMLASRVLESIRLLSIASGGGSQDD